MKNFLNTFFALIIYLSMQNFACGQCTTKPANFGADVTSSSISFSWEDPTWSTLTSYHFQYREKGASTWIEEEFGQYDLSYLTGLQANTVYEARVAGRCSNNDLSDYVTLEIRTCSNEVQTVPWVESFEDCYVPRLSCLNTVKNTDVSPNFSLWQSNNQTSNGRGARTGKNSLTIGAMGAYWLCKEVYLTPDDYIFELYARASNTASSISVNLSTGLALADLKSGTPVVSKTTLSGSNDYKRLFGVFNVAVAGTYYIAVSGENAGNNTGTHFLTIDDLGLTSLSGCLAPVDLEVSNVTSSTAELSFATFLGYGDEIKSFLIQYKPIDSDEDFISIETDETTAILSDLEPSTVYTVQVASLCTDENYSDFETITFKTHCAPATATYEEGFEDGTNNTNIEGCYSQLLIGSGTNYWRYSTSNARSGSFSALLTANATNHGAVLFRGVKLNKEAIYEFTFYARQQQSFSNDSIKVVVCSDRTLEAVNSGIVVIPMTRITAVSPAYQALSNRFTVPEDAEYILGIRGLVGYNGVAMNMDDISLKAIYTVEASATGNGTVSDEGTIEIYGGNSKTYTFTPDVNYRIIDVLINGESVGAVEEYAIEEIDRNYTIEVIFDLIRPVLTANIPEEVIKGLKNEIDIEIDFEDETTYFETIPVRIKVEIDNENVILAYQEESEYVNVEFTSAGDVYVGYIGAAVGFMMDPETPVNIRLTVTEITDYHFTMSIVDAATDEPLSREINEYEVTAFVPVLVTEIPAALELDVAKNFTVNIELDGAHSYFDHVPVRIKITRNKEGISLKEGATDLEFTDHVTYIGTAAGFNLNEANTHTLSLLGTIEQSYTLIMSIVTADNDELIGETVTGNMNVSVGIQDFKNPNINVYSTNQKVFVVNNSSTTITQIQIVDIFGRTVFQEKTNNSNSQTVMNMNVATGTYFVRVFTAHSIQNYKVIIH